MVEMNNVVTIRPVFHLLSFFLFLLCFITNFSTHGVHCSTEKKLLSLRDFQWKQPSGVPSCASQNSRRVKGVTILEMKHRDYCSEKAVDWEKKLKTRLILDDLHVKSLESQFKKRVSRSRSNKNNNKNLDVSEAQIPLISGIKLQILNYIVTVELGGRNMTVIVDTGSVLTWVQCQPCKACYNQKEPLFNPSLSQSYQSIPCNSTTCQSLQFATGNSGVCGSTTSGKTNTPTCNYVVNYGDGSYTRGDLGRDSLNLGATPVAGFVFGCGRSNRGLFGGASGLMGLGRSDLSLITQASSVFGGVFSYCLPSTEPGSSGSLVMGFDISAYKNSTPISYTKMVPNPQLPSFYFLNLTGISIGGVELHQTAPLSSFSQGGILIDSGTVITRLAPSAYKAVKAEFVKQFSGFPLAPGFSILDTCFNLTGYEEVNIPTMKMLFEGGAEMNIDVTGILYMVKSDASQICLALASLSYEDEIGIIGNYQQKNQRVVYDTKESKLGFAGETCSFI